MNNVFIGETNHIYIAMPPYNLIEYSDNYSDKSGSLWQFKRDEGPANDADLSIYNSKSFKYEAVLVGKTANTIKNTNSFVKSTKLVVPLKYLSNFWISLETPLINCKIHLELNWIEDYILSIDGDSEKFKIMDAKLAFYSTHFHPSIRHRRLQRSGFYVDDIPAVIACTCNSATWNRLSERLGFNTINADLYETSNLTV